MDKAYCEYIKYNRSDGNGTMWDDAMKTTVETQDGDNGDGGDAGYRDIQEGK